jgi:two-component system, NtrC family, nitrogen regulation sensor histidine kinase NtrY
MSFRSRLLAGFALTVFVSVAAVTLIVSAVTRRAFERANDERTTALVAQFQHAFNRRGEEVVQRVEAVAATDISTRLALNLNRNAPNYAAYLSEAKSLADSQKLDFLELADSDGTIISSAQWPAKFGYHELFSLTGPVPKDVFLRQEDLPTGPALGLSAIRKVDVGDKSLYVIGGRRMDKNFMASLELPNGMRAMLYQKLSEEKAGAAVSLQYLIDPSGTLQQPDRVAPLIEHVLKTRQETTAIVHWSSDASDDESVHAIPLGGQDNQILAVLILGSSRRSVVELQQHIRSAALLAASVGIALAILFSRWTAARVTRPVEQLADAAREIAAGNWNTKVPVTSSDELGALAKSFNRMTGELLEQKEQLVKTERVAAWRELARRLAHELKNPMFPLQLTVENLIRAREQSPEQFEEVFQESSSTLLAEISNLKTIVSRFSEFSSMPQPQFQSVQINDIVRNVVRLLQAQLQSGSRIPIECKLELSGSPQPIAADPDLLYRAVSNLVFNALDAMPQGGRLTLRTRDGPNGVLVEISDTGIGLSAEDRGRLFTPYYTSKADGTGLGLAIVQSIVNDHGARISVRSQPGQGTTFVVELPRNLDKLPVTGLIQTEYEAKM